MSTLRLNVCRLCVKKKKQKKGKLSRLATARRIGSSAQSETNLTTSVARGRGHAQCTEREKAQMAKLTRFGPCSYHIRNYF